MNKKIKIIDVINKIANGEEVPRHIKYEHYQYDWSDNSRDYICEKADGESLHMFNDGYICILCNSLNDEVEILEDNTEKIEELKYDVVDENGRGWYKLDTIADKVTELIKSVNAIREKPYEAIQVVLNELDKKDKVIDMMANELRDTCHFEYMSRKEVKEYFYNKIEIPKEI